MRTGQGKIEKFMLKIAMNNMSYLRYLKFLAQEKPLKHRRTLKDS